MPTVALIGPELFPIPPIRGGATELFIEQVASRFGNWRPVVIGVSDPLLPLRERRGQVEYVRIPLKSWRHWLYCRYRHYFPYYDRQVARVLAQVQPDLIHVHNRPLLALSLKRRLPPGVPVVLHMHNLFESLGRRERPPLGTSLPLEGFFACSRFVLEREKTRLGKDAAMHRVIYNGVDPELFVPLWDRQVEAKRLRRQYQIADEPVVLFAGKLRASKGVQILLQAMARVWQSVPRAVLVLAGGTEFGRDRTMRQTPFFKELRQQITRARGRVVLTGFIPPEQMPQAYLLGDIFVGPSQIGEGLGLVFLEAAAVGLPIIATRMGGIPEVVREGETGLLLTQKNDAGELADKIIRLLDDGQLRQRLGRQGREWVEANFSWEKTASTLEGVYDEVQGAGGKLGGVSRPLKNAKMH